MRQRHVERQRGLRRLEPERPDLRLPRFRRRHPGLQRQLHLQHGQLHDVRQRPAERVRGLRRLEPQRPDLRVPRLRRRDPGLQLDLHGLRRHRLLEQHRRDHLQRWPRQRWRRPHRFPGPRLRGLLRDRAELHRRHRQRQRRLRRLLGLRLRRGRRLSPGLPGGREFILCLSSRSEHNRVRLCLFRRPDQLVRSPCHGARVHGECKTKQRV